MPGIPKLDERLSLDAFLAMPEIDERPYLEYIDGRVVPKVSPQRKHSGLAGGFQRSLDDFALPRGLGQSFADLRCTFGGRSIVPDVVFHLEANIEVDAEGNFIDDVRVAPDIHIEIISPKQGVADAADKIAHSLAHGGALGWLVHPYRRTIDEYRPGLPPRRLAEDEALDGHPVLPGFRLPVADVWDWMKRRRRPGGEG
jgi:Uma2 family endonuclease